MSINSTAGALVDIGPATTTAATMADFQAYGPADWLDIGLVEDLGELGGEAEQLLFKAIGEKATRRLKGTPDYGSMELVLGRDPLNRGQQELQTAFRDHRPYAFRVRLEDAPVGGTPSTFYFRAMVSSFRHQLGAENNITRTNVALGIDGEVFEVPAALGLNFSPVMGALTAGEEGTVYAGVTIAATGGTGTASYAVTDGNLPPGLSLNASTGAISGTPTTAGTYNFTITATYSTSGTGAAVYSITVDPA
ncbi:Ig domain-containing protein [Pararhodobacter aggregans]|uniref:Uncharacterized protein n=1 Tax=Pararhodobacter aggregans TaxID=404875 RepID=A0A2T7UWD7_9RHOB|nr:Ig domain-containing protein [Pararhodobacter aggregans]PTX04604.1 putative Ig domain-containing protein [Pararhodobacter aggregans]PVE48944.1 hypothetical protein DDE23_00620 [Pararhodobacter aggregans]